MKKKEVRKRDVNKETHCHYIYYTCFLALGSSQTTFFPFFLLLFFEVEDTRHYYFHSCQRYLQRALLCRLLPVLFATSSLIFLLVWSEHSYAPECIFGIELWGTFLALKSLHVGFLFFRSGICSEFAMKVVRLILALVSNTK